MVCGVMEAYLSKCVFNILESPECLIMKEIQTKFIFNQLFVITFSNEKNNSMTKTVTESGECV